MKLKTKLTLGVSSLVLVVVLAVNLVYLTAMVREQTQQVYASADFLCRAVYNQMSQDLVAAHDQGKLRGDPATAYAAFFQGLHDSQPLSTLFNSAIGYPIGSAIRDVALVSPQGIIVLDSNPGLTGRPAPPRRLFTDIVHANAWQHYREILDGGGDAIYNVSLATQVDSRPLGTISVGVDTVLLRDAMLSKIGMLAIWGALVVVLATVLAWSLAEFILSPLRAIQAQLAKLTARVPLLAAPTPATAAPLDLPSPPRADEFGQVSSGIQRLGQQIEDVRQIYTTLQDNVGHLLRGMEEGLLLFDAQGRAVLSSDAIPRLLRLPSGQIAGHAVEELFPGDSALDQAIRQAVRAAVAMPQREGERRPGERPLQARLELVRNGDHALGSLLTLRDPEPARRVENELEVARRLTQLGRLTRGVAHEVKNPLNAMAIHLDLMREKAGPNHPQLQPHVEIMRREIDRLDRVVRTFLDFSRPVELRLSELDLGELAQSVASLIRAEAESRGMQVEIAIQPGVPPVRADRDLIEQALLNLANNSLQAMELMESAPGRLRLEVLQHKDQPTVRVSDTGPGIPPELRDRVFDLYFTTRPEGTGAGLTLAARIMQLHHGALDLESTPAGASFLLQFAVPAPMGDTA